MRKNLLNLFVFLTAIFLAAPAAPAPAHQAYFKASNTEANDRFGYSVAVSGDTLAVGAVGEASNATG